MARQKKDYIQLHIKADTSVMERFIRYCDEMGQTKTMAFERIVAAYLDEHDAAKKKTNNSK